MSYPTLDDTSDPVFVAIWQTIRGWNLERTRGAELAWANGMDAFAILQAVRASLSGAQQGESEEQLWRPTLGSSQSKAREALRHSVRAMLKAAKDDEDIEELWHAMEAAVVDVIRTAAPTQPAPGGEDWRDARIRKLKLALIHAEAALADIGDADRESADDVAWCEQRAADALPIVREALSMSPPPTSRPFTPEEHAAWERENGVGEAAEGEGERG